VPTIDAESRKQFISKCEPIKNIIKENLKKENDILMLIQKDNAGVEYKKLLLSEQMIYVATLYLAINNLSVSLLEAKNNDALNDARKSIYKAIIYLEQVVSNTVDCPYTDLEPRLQTIVNVPIEKRYYLVRKLGLAIDMLWTAFGDNSKWKWSFVDIRGRYAIVAKNLVDMKAAAKDYFDPNSQDYDTTVLYIRLLRTLIEKSSGEYRDKYELSTRRIDDMRIAINLLIAKRRIAMILGEREEAEEIKKKASVWKDKMDADQKAGKTK